MNPLRSPLPVSQYEDAQKLGTSLLLSRQLNSQQSDNPPTAGRLRMHLTQVSY